MTFYSIKKILLSVIVALSCLVLSAQNNQVNIVTNTGDTSICLGGSLTLSVENCDNYISANQQQIGYVFCTDSSILSPEVFPGSGKVAEGIIYWISDDASQIWLLSLHNQGLIPFSSGANEGVALPIPDLPLPPEAGTFLDGELYTQQIRDAGGPTDYPAAWTVDHQNGWYIPSLTQWLEMLPNFALLNSGLAAAGGDLLDKAKLTEYNYGYPVTMYLACSEVNTPLAGPDYARIWNFAFDDEPLPHYIGNYKSDMYYSPIPYTLRASKNINLNPISCEITWTRTSDDSTFYGCSITTSPTEDVIYNVEIRCNEEVFNGQQEILVNQPIEIDIINNPIDTIHCVGEMFTMSIDESIFSNSIESSGTALWSWTPGNGTAEGNSITRSAAETTTFELKYSYGNNCVSIANQTIIIVPTETAFSESDICNSDSVQLISQSGATEYLWQPQQNIVNGNTESPIVFPSESVVYTSSYKIGNVCHSDTFNVNVHNGTHEFLSDTICAENLPYSDGVFYAESAGEYSVILTNIYGCDSVLTLNLAVENPVELGIVTKSGNDYVCAGEKVVLSLTATNNFNNIVWTSKPEDETFSGEIIQHLPSQTTTYYADAFSNLGCLSRDSFTVEVRPLPSMDIIFNQENYCDSGFSRMEVVGNVQNVIWSTGENTASIDIIYPGTFVVIGELDGCTSELNYKVEKCEHSVYVPSAFSPGYDGMNDFFMPKCIAFESLKMYVYDRWGKLVFYTDSPDKPWDGTFDGKICPTGVYTYYLIYTTTNRPGYDIHRWGSVTLVQ